MKVNETNLQKCLNVYFSNIKGHQFQTLINIILSAISIKFMSLIHR